MRWRTPWFLPIPQPWGSWKASSEPFSWYYSLHQPGTWTWYSTCSTYDSAVWAFGFLLSFVPPYEGALLEEWVSLGPSWQTPLHGVLKEYSMLKNSSRRFLLIWTWINLVICPFSIQNLTITGRTRSSTLWISDEFSLLLAEDEHFRSLWLFLSIADRMKGEVISSERLLKWISGCPSPLLWVYGSPWGC